MAAWNVPRCSGRMEGVSFATDLVPDVLNVMPNETQTLSQSQRCMASAVDINMYVWGVR